MTENRENVNNAAAVDGGVNNMAAMREALKQALYFLRRHHTGAVYAPDGETLIFCEDVAGVVDSALSAPPRNCDRFADFNEAIRTFAKERPNDKKKWDMERYARFAMWLLALTEKGETDGSK